MRQIIISLLGLLILGGALYGARHMVSQKKQPERKSKKRVPQVKVDTIYNQDIRVDITSGGTLEALRRIELFAEVQGIFERGKNRFVEGVSYQNGDLIISINSEEHLANLKAQKSNFYNQLVTILPDLGYEFPDSFEKWQNYANTFDINGPIRPLPAYDSDQEKLFVVGRNLESSWYAVKNLEERLDKYEIRAPFAGVLTEALVEEGSLIRVGQKLGTIIKPDHYELKVGINASHLDLVKPNTIVTLQDLAQSSTWKGKVTRINKLIDPATQMVEVFIEVSGRDLREGMYLEAQVNAKRIPNAAEISRKLLVQNEKIWLVENNTIRSLSIQPVFFKDKTAVVKGIPDGAVIVSQAIPGLHDGLEVKVRSQQQ